MYTNDWQVSRDYLATEGLDPLRISNLGDTVNRYCNATFYSAGENWNETVGTVGRNDVINSCTYLALNCNCK